MNKPLGLFEGFGVELEYMLVDEQLNVAPCSDRLLEMAGQGEVIDGEVERGPASWSNELVLHVLEMKTNGPAPSLAGLASMFQQQIREANRLLSTTRHRLLPTGMHPWMNPDREMRLWPHDNSEVYRAFHRVFDCRGHGWANLQSVHLNLPFRDDEEFARLHAAVRLLLPLLPALAASSPLCEERLQPELDHRLQVYMSNSRRVPEVTGLVIPEPVNSRQQYEQQILAPMYRAIAPLDPDGTLQHEWLNARGATAKFSRQTIEIRLLDVQEYPAADLAICAATVAVLRQLVQESLSPWRDQQAAETPRLLDLLKQVVVDGEQARLTDGDYLRLLGYSAGTPCTAGQLWRHLLEPIDRDSSLAFPGELRGPLGVILDRGPLARRIRQALPSAPSRSDLEQLYERLAVCLAEGEPLP